MRITWRSVGLVELGSVLAVSGCGRVDWFGFSFAPPAAPFFVYRRRLEFVIELGADADCAARGFVNRTGAKSIPGEERGGEGTNVLLLEIDGIVATVEVAGKLESIAFIRNFQG